MQYCINIIKSNQIKSNQELYTLNNNFLKIFLIALLSFIALFSISCNNAYAPLGYDIPTTSGELVTDRAGTYFYGGDFTRSKLEVSPETEKNIAEAETIFPSIYILAGVSMYNDEISVEAPYSTIKDAPFYDTGIFCNARVDNGNVKSYIKYQYIPYSGITVEYIVAIITNSMGIRATYTGILENHSPIE